MQNTTFDTIYKDVPQAQKEQLRRFRATHPYRHVKVGEIEWVYLSCGQGTETLLLLPGGTRLADAFFQLIPAFEHDYHVLAPSYPPVPTMATLLEGIAAMLEAESVQRAHIVGPSFGGWVAQCFVRRFPEKVATLILSDTGLPRKGRAIAGNISLPLLSALPTRMVHALLTRELTSLLPALPQGEGAFWMAYFTEVLARTTKDDLLCLWKCAIDLHQHYRFTPTDLVLWPGHVLILDSDDDPAIAAPVRARLKALYPGAQTYTFHQAGHTPFLTRREEYLSVVERFLKEQCQVSWQGRA